jgi:dienelactone hydrolase
MRGEPKMRPIFAILLSGLMTMAAHSAELKTEMLVYESTVDQTKPLQAEVAYAADGKKKPLIVVMHGYGGNKKDVAPDIRELAEKGLFAIAPDMRGAGGSAGKFDSGGVEIHDIVDAVLVAIKKFPNEIDARNLNVVGYSGGGGNAISCAVRFPDLFRTCNSFFGISDYGAWNKSKGRPDCNAKMERAIGTMDAEPDAYAARNANLAAGNVQTAKMHFFWDEAETQCPPDMIKTFVESHEKAGLKNCTTHISKYGDKLRWKHGYRSGNKALSEADALFLPDIQAPLTSSPRLPKKGTLVVNGYLITRHFSVWIGDGQKGSVKISYDVSNAQPVVKVIENPKNFTVKIGASPFADLP